MRCLILCASLGDLTPGFSSSQMVFFSAIKNAVLRKTPQPKKGRKQSLIDDLALKEFNEFKDREQKLEEEHLMTNSPSKRCRKRSRGWADKKPHSVYCSWTGDAEAAEQACRNIACSGIEQKRGAAESKPGEHRKCLLIFRPRHGQ